MSRMVPYQENDTALFLYAILKQVKVRDVDWSAVAQDPVLLRPIPNGHAARMRYLRFRNSLKVKPPIREELSAREIKPLRQSRKKTTEAPPAALEVPQQARSGGGSQTHLSAPSWQYHKAAFAEYPSPPPLDPYDDRLGGLPTPQSDVFLHGISRCSMPTEPDHAAGGLVCGLDRGEAYAGYAAPSPAIDSPGLNLDAPGEDLLDMNPESLNLQCGSTTDAVGSPFLKNPAIIRARAGELTPDTTIAGSLRNTISPDELLYLENSYRARGREGGVMPDWSLDEELLLCTADASGGSSAPSQESVSQGRGGFNCSMLR